MFSGIYTKFRLEVLETWVSVETQFWKFGLGLEQ